jgi:hypothetical protein
MIYTSMTNATHNQIMQEYNAKLEEMSLQELVAEFFTYLDVEEESDSGRVFNPVTISCCRVLLSEPLSQVISKLRRACYYPPVEEWPVTDVFLDPLEAQSEIDKAELGEPDASSF